MNRLSHSEIGDLPNDLNAAGDQMQSALSRIIEYVRTTTPFANAPYEVCMALLEGETAIREWTEARRG